MNSLILGTFYTFFGSEEAVQSSQKAALSVPTYIDSIPRILSEHGCFIAQVLDAGRAYFWRGYVNTSRRGTSFLNEYSSSPKAVHRCRIFVDIVLSTLQS